MKKRAGYLVISPAGDNPDTDFRLTPFSTFLGSLSGAGLGNLVSTVAEKDYQKNWKRLPLVLGGAALMGGITEYDRRKRLAAANKPQAPLVGVNVRGRAPIDMPPLLPTEKEASSPRLHYAELLGAMGPGKSSEISDTITMSKGAALPGAGKQTLGEEDSIPPPPQEEKPNKQPRSKKLPPRKVTDALLQRMV